MLIRRSETPVVTCDKPWEAGSTCLYLRSVVEDEQGRPRMYYTVAFKDPCAHLLCVAFSDDGETWEKPTLESGDNIVMRSTATGFGWGEFELHNIVLDPKEEDPDQRWKMAYWDQPKGSTEPGICLATSPDGFSWKPVRETPMITCMNDAFSLAIIDGERNASGLKGRNVIFQQTWKYNPNLPIDRDNLKYMHRRISAWTNGGMNGYWKGPILVLEPDESDPPDLQFYSFQVFPLETGFGGLLWCYHTTEQVMEVYAARSPDGIAWRRIRRDQPILDVGKPGRFDCGMVQTSASPIFRDGQCLLYYRGTSHCHDLTPRYKDPVLGGIKEGVGLAVYSEKEFKQFFEE